MVKPICLLVVAALVIGLGQGQLSSPVPSTVSAPKVTGPPLGANLSICYKFVGCFDNFPPFNHNGGELPDPPELVGTVFLLYTSAGQKEGEQLTWADRGLSVNKASFNPQLQTKFVIHGFSQNENESWLHSMKDALFTQGPMNVVIVGWGAGAKAPDYPQAVANTRIVAKQIQLLIGFMLSRGSTLNKIHLIGHSLGAHISGYVGAGLKGQLSRISGMDPAGPLFMDTDPMVRLDATDAQFVDVIHSNAAPIHQAGVGYPAPCGHADFYPNGGEWQPGCPGLISGAWDLILNGKIGEIGAVASCSHGRAYNLYIESIASKHCHFLSTPCESWAKFQEGSCNSCKENDCSELGYHAIEYKAKGVFYLATKASPKAFSEDGQFCGSSYYIAISPSPNQKNIKGEIQLKIIGKDGVFSTQYQGSSSTLEAQSKAVIIGDSDIGELLSIQIYYTQYEGWFGFGNGEKEWSLDYVVISHQSDEKRFCEKSPVTIKSKQLVTIRTC